MKNLRNAFAILLLVLTQLSVNAQVRLGATGGVAISQFNIPLIKELPFLDIKQGAGATSGVLAQVPLYGPISVRTEANYTVRNYRVTLDPSAIDESISNLPVKLTANLKSRYFEIPLLLQVDLGSGPVGGYVLGGASLAAYNNSKLGLGLFGTQLVSVPINNIGFRKTEWSGVAGAGLRVDAGFGDILFEGRYQFGLTNLVEIPAIKSVNLTPKNRNNSIILKAGLAIPLTQKSARPKRPVAVF